MAWDEERRGGELSVAVGRAMTRREWLSCGVVVAF